MVFFLSFKNVNSFKFTFFFFYKDYVTLGYSNACCFHWMKKMILTRKTVCGWCSLSFFKNDFFMHLFIFQAILIIYFHFCVPPCRKIFFIKFIYLYKSFTHTNKPRFLAQKIPCSGQLSHDLKNVHNLKKWCIENTFSTTKCAKVGLNPSCHTWYQSI